MADAPKGVEMRRSVRPGLLEGRTIFHFAHVTAFGSNAQSICIFAVDLEEGVIIINYSMTARVVDNGEVVEDTKEHRKRCLCLF